MTGATCNNISWENIFWHLLRHLLRHLPARLTKMSEKINGHFFTTFHSHMITSCRALNNVERLYYLFNKIVLLIWDFLELTRTQVSFLFTFLKANMLLIRWQILSVLSLLKFLSTKIFKEKNCVWVWGHP